MADEQEGGKKKRRKPAKGSKGKAGKGKGKKPGKKPGKRKRRKRAPVNYKQMKALSEEIRVPIYEILCERMASPKEISEELGESLSNVSYHVIVLLRCGLIELDHTVPRRGAVEHFYRAATPTLVPPNAWDDLSPAARRQISLDILQEFFEDAHESVKAELFDGAPGELSWTPLLVDPAGVKELGKLSREFVEAALQVHVKSNERTRGKKGVKLTSVTAFLASFLSARSPKEGKKASATKRR